MRSGQILDEYSALLRDWVCCVREKGELRTTPRLGGKSDWKHGVAIF